MTRSKAERTSLGAGAGVAADGVSARRRASAHAALIAAMLIWGSTFVVTKHLLDEAPPFFIAFARFAIALAVLWPLLLWRGDERAAFPLRRDFAALGALGVAANFGLQNLGLAFTGAADAALIIALTPVPIAVMAAAFLGERLVPRQWIGIALSIGGVALVTGVGIQASAAAVAGDLLVAASTLAWAGYTLLGRRLAPAYGAGAIATGAIGWGLVFLSAPALVEVVAVSPPGLSLAGIAGLAYLGVGASAATFVLWNSALAAVGAATAGTFLNLIPVFGLGFALLAEETVSGAQLGGAAAVVFGVWLATARPKPRTRLYARPTRGR